MQSLDNSVTSHLDLLQPQMEQRRRPNRCARITSGVANCVKKIGLGAAAAAVISPISIGIDTLAQRWGYIQERSFANMLKGVTPNDVAAANSIANAACPTQELAKQLNEGWHFVIAKGWKIQLDQGLYPEIQPHPIVNATTCPAFPFHTPDITAFQLKAFMVTLVLSAAVTEEIFFRGCASNGIKKATKCIVARKAPEKLSFLDSKTAKAMRVTLTAALFSASHLMNSSIGVPEAYVQGQVVTTFFLGLGYGVLKETPAGLIGCITAHGIHNTYAVAKLILGC